MPFFLDMIVPVGKVEVTEKAETSYYISHRILEN